MSLVRHARGGRFRGRHRLRSSVIVGIAVAAGAVPAPPAVAGSNPFAVRGMWIWELPSSNGGNVRSIIARAHTNGISTLMVKSGDGASAWSQFNPHLVAALHAAGFRVCAWQYVYGVHPGGEAKVGAAAVRDGADCLLIDAEAEYEGRYVPAQTYMRTLRGLIGSRFPVALAGFPYIDFHPAFPYSVFLGRGGAQFNVPQMYWFDIGTSVDRVYSHTYEYNRIYGRAIAPLGQIYNNPPARDIHRFRQLARFYGARGVSWWDWQEGSGFSWHAMSQPVGTLSSFRADPKFAALRKGNSGDIVVWAQEHLASAGQSLAIDGAFGPGTRAAVQAFQAAHGLQASGTIGTLTWHALLRYRPVNVTWTSRGARIASAAATTTLPVPRSASLPAKRDEIAHAGGAGHSRR